MAVPPPPGDVQFDTGLSAGVRRNKGEIHRLIEDRGLFRISSFAHQLVVGQPYPAFLPGEDKLGLLQLQSQVLLFLFRLQHHAH